MYNRMMPTTTTTKLCFYCRLCLQPKCANIFQPIMHRGTVLLLLLNKLLFLKLLVFLSLFIGATASPTNVNYSALSVQYGSVPSVPPSCSIPSGLHGVYKRQNENVPPDFYEGGVRGPIRYVEIFVGPTAVPVWGDCISSKGNAFVLGKKKTSGYICYRCFLLIQRSHNVLQVVTQSEDLCYRNQEAAQKSCRDFVYVKPGEGIILWRSENIRHEHCPLGGKASLSYSESSGISCPLTAPIPSTISNCYLGYQLDIKFRSCSMPNYDLSLQCLGSWDAGRGNGESYFAVFNTDAQEYRCGIFRDLRDQREGVILASLSNDSTCAHSLVNSSQGHEVFVFHPEDPPSWPSSMGACTFADWLQGDWGVLTVGTTLMSYYHSNDPTTLATVYAKCVEADEKNAKIRIFSRTQCGDPIGYHCLWVERRSDSVLELKMGNKVVAVDEEQLCYEHTTFDNASWITLSDVTERDPKGGLSRFNHVGAFSSPTSRRGGSSTGDACFNVTVDCHNAYHMTTTVYRCGSDNDIIEANQYQCLASWKEGNRYYSYARRIEDDVRGCFISEYINGQLYMVWTANKCDRNVALVDMQYTNDIDKNLFILVQNEYCKDGDSRHTVPEIVDTAKKSSSVAIRHNWCLSVICIVTLILRMLYCNTYIY